MEFSLFLEYRKYRKGMGMNEEYRLTPYETREILFYKTDNGEVRVEILYIRKICG